MQKNILIKVNNDEKNEQKNAQLSQYHSRRRRRRHLKYAVHRGVVFSIAPPNGILIVAN